MHGLSRRRVELDALSPGRAPPLRRVTSHIWEWMRHHASALVSTAIDYAVMVAAVELARVEPVPATTFGGFAGAITIFTMSRHFTSPSYG